MSQSIKKESDMDNSHGYVVRLGMDCYCARIVNSKGEVWESPVYIEKRDAIDWLKLNE